MAIQTKAKITKYHHICERRLIEGVIEF